MDWKILSTVFTSVFIAELGDKTQLATMLFASDKDASKLTVFAGAALALVVTSAIGVAGGLCDVALRERKDFAICRRDRVHRHRHLDAFESLTKEFLYHEAMCQQYREPDLIASFFTRVIVMNQPTFMSRETI